MPGGGRRPTMVTLTKRARPALSPPRTQTDYPDTSRHLTTPPITPLTSPPPPPTPPPSRSGEVLWPPTSLPASQGRAFTWRRLLRSPRPRTPSPTPTTRPSPPPRDDGSRRK